MRFRSLAIRRVVFVVPVLLGITIVTFTLVHMLPGDPARQLAGPFASPEAVAKVRDDMGLTDEPVVVQYWSYLERVGRGDLGYSWFNSEDVRDGLANRFFATFELITFALLLALFLIALVVASQLSGRRFARVVERAARGYSLFAGSVPDFWVGLVLLYLFFRLVPIAPAPLGRLDVTESPPPQITGLYTVDSLVTGNWTLFLSALEHLALPAVTLAVVYGTAILKITLATLSDVMQSPFISAGRMLGLPRKVLLTYAVRNTLPPVVIVIATTYGFLLGGAVLVESIFAWGGIGEYAVDAVVNSDYAAIQGFVIVAALFMVVIFLVLDLLYIAIDPRSE